MNNKLDWKDNTKTFDKKKHTPKALSLHSSKNAGSTAVDLFLTVVTSAIFHGVVCWGSSISAADRKRGQLCLGRPSRPVDSLISSLSCFGRSRRLHVVNILLSEVALRDVTSQSGLGKRVLGKFEPKLLGYVWLRILHGYLKQKNDLFRSRQQHHWVRDEQQNV